MAHTPHLPDFRNIEHVAESDIKKLEKTANRERHLIAKTILEKRRAAFERFPLLFTLLGTFGLVATLYGFEGIIDQIAFLNNNKFILLLVGIGTLAVTGSLYKKLGS